MLYAAYQPQLDILSQVSFTEMNGGGCRLLHRKKPRLPGIRRTRAGLDLRCRPYGGLCRTRTGACRPRLHGPASTCAVVVRHMPVLGHSSRPSGRQDSVLDRHILRHCSMCRSHAGITGLDLLLPDLCRTRTSLGRRLRHRAARAPYAQVPAQDRTLCDVGRHFPAMCRHLSIWVRQRAATGRQTVMRYIKHIAY
jgi:hypothetical protein